MDTSLWIVIIVAAVVVVGLGAWLYLQRQQTERLRGRFGPEYDRAIQEQGAQRRAEAELEAREKRVEQLDIHPLPPAERRRFTDAWHSVQARFVDDPAGALKEADRLVTEVMQARGYPMSDFEQRAADISVDHPRVVENYRTAREIVVRNERGQASTEELRKAMIHYRALFEDLLEIQQSAQTKVRP
jgi:hypothetical protein